MAFVAAKSTGDCVANRAIAAPAVAPNRMSGALRIIREPFQGLDQVSNYDR
jgi:hypothetical protein